MHKTIIFSIIIIVFLSIHVTTLKNNINIKLTSQLDFVSEALRFCNGKAKKNFCSDQSLRIMFEIEKQRLKLLEIRHGITNMVKKIVESIWGIELRRYSLQ